MPGIKRRDRPQWAYGEVGTDDPDDTGTVTVISTPRRPRRPSVRGRVMASPEVYEASPLKRRRATQDEMEARAKFLIDYAAVHGPVTVRGLYYQAEVAGVPGVDKTNSSYVKVQRQVLNLRREGRLAYGDISDATRWMRKPRSHHRIEDALAETASLYRRALWFDADSYVEVWCEKDALAGAIYPVTIDVRRAVDGGSRLCLGDLSVYEAIAARGGRWDRPRDYYVYYLGDFDRAGQDATRAFGGEVKAFRQRGWHRSHLRADSRHRASDRGMEAADPKAEAQVSRRQELAPKVSPASLMQFRLTIFAPWSRRLSTGTWTKISFGP